METHGPEISEMRNLAERSRWLLDELREKSDAASARRREQLEHFGSDATELIEQVAAQIAKELAEDLTNQFNEDRSEQLRAIESEREAIARQQADWETERNEWEAVREQIEQELAERESQLEARESAAGHQNADAEHGQHELDQAREEQQRYAAELEGATARIAELEAAIHASAEAQEKLDIALGDLQHHREQIASLEEQLASRPAEGGADSEEMARLRQERDELDEQLRQALASQVAGGGEGGDADLQRRFEMAVEDLRQLKQENAELQDKLASGGGSSSSGGGDLSDWEAQKRKLLASLEGEEPTEDEARKEEIAKINATIQITDGVVAEKDREIEELRTQLENAPQGESPPSESEEEAQEREALLDADEVVQAERQRLEDLEKEGGEKLRTAELELSVERAKIARSQSEMAEQLEELEAYRKKYNNEFGDKGGGGRNWFNKLGLGSDNSDD